MIHKLLDIGTENLQDTKTIVNLVQNTFYTYGNIIVVINHEEGYIVDIENRETTLAPIFSTFIKRLDVPFHFSKKLLSQNMKVIINANQLKKYTVGVDLSLTEAKIIIKNNELTYLKPYKRQNRALNKLTNTFMTHYPLKSLIGAIVAGNIKPQKQNFIYQVLISGFGKSLIIESLIQSSIGYEVKLATLANSKQNNIYNIEAIAESLCLIEDEFRRVDSSLFDITFNAHINEKFKTGKRVQIPLKLLFSANKANVDELEAQADSRFKTIDVRNILPITAKDWYEDIKQDGKKVIQSLTADIPTLVTQCIKEVLSTGKEMNDYIKEIEDFLLQAQKRDKAQLDRMKKEGDKSVINVLNDEFAEKMRDDIFDILYSASPDTLKDMKIPREYIIKTDDYLFIRQPKKTISKALYFATTSDKAKQYMSFYTDFELMENLVKDHKKIPKKTNGKPNKGILIYAPKDQKEISFFDEMEA